MSGDVYNNLMDERREEAQGQLANAGLTRSGAAVEEMARLSSATGMDIESMLYGRLGNNVETGLNATHGVAGVGQNTANQISGTLNQQGNNEFATMLAELGFNFEQSEQSKNRAFTASENEKTRAANLELADKQQHGGGGGGGSFWGDVVNGFATGYGAYLATSDRRLKTSIEKIGKTQHLNVYKWEWVDGLPDSIKSEPNQGFMADEVMEKFPEHVYKIGGFMKVDYQSVKEAHNESR